MTESISHDGTLARYYCSENSYHANNPIRPYDGEYPTYDNENPYNRENLTYHSEYTLQQPIRPFDSENPIHPRENVTTTRILTTAGI